MNWTPDQLFTARDKPVQLRDGTTANLKLYMGAGGPDGWAFGDAMRGADALAMCFFLNSAGARIA